MKTLTIREMRASLGQLGNLVHDEGEILITRHGKAIARVVPVEARRSIPARKELRSTMSELSPSSDLVREDRASR